eukprot:TRINITY_DN7759_c0_g1_i1.p1 TRINITY_DN7759_c0_g1~~TRINITY_DN7759_c0_g1_i1.p1  ORF type:complete len:340 (-),score=200.36 TRINITY_DN7759_c0_g1_i1:90-1109(-)
MYSDYEVGFSNEDRKNVEKLLHNETHNEHLPAHKALLRNTNVGSLFPEGRATIISVPSTASVADAFKVLIESKVTAVPVIDETKKKHIGFLGMSDVVAMITREFTNAELEANSDDLIVLLKSKSNITGLKVLDIMDLSGRNAYYPVEESANLQTAIDLLVKWAVHRIPVVDSEKGNLVTLLTQSQVVSFLQKHIGGFPFAKKTVGDLQLGYKKVVSVNQNENAATAFRQISCNKVQGIAVVNDQEQLVGNLSANDLKVIGHAGKLIPLLLVPLTEYFKFSPENATVAGPVTVNAATTIEELLLKINFTKVHRVYVTDGAQKVQGIISLVDVIELFALDK